MWDNSKKNINFATEYGHIGFMLNSWRILNSYVAIHTGVG